MKKMKQILVIILIVSFGMQLSLHAQVPLCFEVKIERELREDTRAGSHKCSSDLFIFDGFRLPAFLSRLELSEFSSFILFYCNRQYSNFSKDTFLNHSPPASS